ncbi:OmpA family protein [Sorangium sp. So ce321]|uniref:OmpA family protein n=1 Tax=Sorangium sp. So ce321 TaxID=3133300 RepID=UPI003F628F36
MRSSFIAMTASIALTMPLAGTARAQAAGGFALNRFEPAPAGDIFFGVPSPDAPGHLEPRVALTFDDAVRPVRLQDTDIAVVSHQAFLRLDASVSLWDRLLLTIDAPLAVIQAGDRPALADMELPELDAPQLGDMRFGARARLFGENASPLQVGVGGYVFAPTGSPEQYTGEGATRGAFYASAGGRLGTSTGLLWNASGGIALGSDTSPSRFTFGAGAAALLVDDHLQLGPEIYGSSPFTRTVVLAGTPPREDEAGVHLEILLGAKLRVLDGLTFGAAAGPGLLEAIGTPQLRIVGLVGWTPLPTRPTGAEADTPAAVGDKDDDGILDNTDACPEIKGEPSADPSRDGCPPSDRDGDSVTDAEDACPAVAGAQSLDPIKNGCPPDGDSDGVADAADACPASPGDKHQDPRRNGCPPDLDRDGILDANDACPRTPGPGSTEPKQNGCPEDADGDGITGVADACPLEHGAKSDDPSRNGCPKFVRVTNEEIVTSIPVQFTLYGKTRSQTVSPVSDELLYEVRDVLSQHPEIELVEVQGHTDDSGTPEFNQTLSEERARAVVDWLVAAGVPRGKLVAKGYSYRRPLGDNREKTGRQENRRVQFFIVRRKPL